MKQATQEAYATTQALRGLAKPLMVATIEALTMGGQIGGSDASQKHALEMKIEESAKSLSIVSDPEPQAAKQKFFRFHTWDHFQQFVFALSRVDQHAGERVRALSKAYDSDDFPTEDAILSALGQDVASMTPEAREFLLDYVYYVNHHELRRPQALPQEERSGGTRVSQHRKLDEPPGMILAAQKRQRQRSTLFTNTLLRPC